MKRNVTRVLSVLLVLALCIGLLSGLTLTVSAAAVDYTYDSTGSYLYNWGQRGTTATFLSPNAGQFYADNNVTYSALSALAGASDADAVPDSALYAALQELMASNHTTVTSYNDTRPLYQYTDCENSGTYSKQISSFYSGKAIGPTWDSGATWNREHVWPNSKGQGGSNVETDRETDIMMLRPTAAKENGDRGNTAYGESAAYYDPNELSGGAYNLHGDVARILLYVYVRWGGDSLDYMWGTSGVIESPEILLKWMEEDPVDTWELGRNDAVESITGTRNVFVDYPELAFVLFGEEVPTDMTTPSGEAIGSGSSYTITATSNNAAWGTVSVSGNTVNAVPAEGYYAAGYTVVSGTATVTQSGNAFTVSAASDCTVQINFAARETVTVSFLQDGTVASGQTVYSGDAITLPEHSGAVSEGYTFVGWAASAVSNTETVPSFRKAGSTYVPEADTLLYALYSFVGESSGDSAGIWTLVTDASGLKAGDQLVIASNEKGFVAGAISSSVMTNVAAAFSDDKNTIPELPADAVILTLGGSEGAWTLAGADGKLLGATKVKKVAWGSGTTTWSISVADGNATIQNGTAGYGRFLYNVSSPRFTTYTSNTSASMLLPQLYVLKTDAGTVYYTTAIGDSCQHSNTTAVSAKAATCTEDGCTSGIFCEDCKTYLSGHETVKATGHSYESVVTPPTVTEDGYTTHTCANCGDTYTDSTVPALGQTYTVSFSVPRGVEAVADMGCNTSGITLPTAGVPAGEHVYTFAGWATEAVDNATAAPAILEAGSTYVATADTTLYAVYTYAVGGTGKTAYVLVESADQLVIGSRVVIASSAHDIAMSTTQGTSGNNRGTAVITKNADKTISFADSANVAEMMLQAGTVDGTYAFYCPVNNGYLYASSSSKNYLKLQTTLNANGSFTVTVPGDGTCVAISQQTGRNNLQYNSGNGIFSCYASGQTAISLYIETADGTLYYTTVVEVPCDHAETELTGKKDATCTEDGYTGDEVCTACGETVARGEVIPAAHTLEKVEAREATTEAEGNLEHYKCTVCGKLFDAEGKELRPEDVVIARLPAVQEPDDDEPPKTDGAAALSLAAIMLLACAGYVTAVKSKKFS